MSVSIKSSWDNKCYLFSMPTLLHLNVIQSMSGSITNDDNHNNNNNNNGVGADADDDDDGDDDVDDAGSQIFVYCNC